MEKKSSYSFRIDERVFFLMALLSIICLLVLAFRYNSDKPCEAIKINVEAPSGFYVGSNIQFKIQLKSANSNTYKWDFGDSADLKYPALPVRHAYKKAGLYTVIVTVNGRCQEIVQVPIKNKPDIVVADLQPKFYGPTSTQIGEPVIFEDATPGATHWEWSFEDGIFDLDLKSRKVSWTYETPGLKKVYLKINGRGDNVGSRTIIVTEPKRSQDETDDSKTQPVRRRRNTRNLEIKQAPTEEPIVPTGEEKKPVEEIKHVEISTEQVYNFLMKVIEGKQSAEDFSKQLCGKLAITVTYNRKPMTFEEMCVQLRKIKKSKKVKKLTPDTKQVNGCITEMRVLLEKKWIPEIFE